MCFVLFQVFCPVKQHIIHKKRKNLKGCLAARLLITYVCGGDRTVPRQARYYHLNNQVMKKFLEVLVDDQGEMHFSTDYEFSDSIENPPTDWEKETKETDQRYRQIIRGLVNTLWKDHNLHVSKAIRFLSMGEIMACAEPYDNAEEFWSAMMFACIPHYESYASSLKKPYGFDPKKMIRPITGVFPGGLSLSDLGKPMN